MGQLEELILKCDKALEIQDKYAVKREDAELRREIVDTFCDCYGYQVAKITRSYLDFSYTKDVSRDDILDIKRQLEAFKEYKDHELDVAGASSSTVAAVANASASIEASFNNTMSQMWALPDDVLSGEQKQELAKMLQKVEDSKGDEGRLKKAGKTVADWLFDNAVKAIPSVMPYITKMIQGVFGS